MDRFRSIAIARSSRDSAWTARCPAIFRPSSGRLNVTQCHGSRGSSQGHCKACGLTSRHIDGRQSFSGCAGDSNHQQSQCSIVPRIWRSISASISVFKARAAPALCCAMKRPSDAMHRRATESSSFASRALIRRALQRTLPSSRRRLARQHATAHAMRGVPIFPRCRSFPGQPFHL